MLILRFLGGAAAHVLLIALLATTGLLHTVCLAAEGAACPVPCVEPTPVMGSAGFDPGDLPPVEAVPIASDAEPIFLGGSETVHRVNGGWILLRVEEWFKPDPVPGRGLQAP